MPDIDLACEIAVLTSEGATDHTEIIASRTFTMPLVKADKAKAWLMRSFRPALAEARDDQVVRGSITGTSEDGSHSLACGTINGWKGSVQMRSGVFDS